MYSSMNNFEENLSKAQEAQTSRVDEVKLKDDIKELDGKLDKLDDVGNKAKWNSTELLDELAKSGVKYNPDDVIAVTKTAEGKLVWLENGNSKAGLEHIMSHADDFASKGIPKDQIKDLVMEALNKGEVVGYQGRGQGRPIYEIIFNGEKYRVAITVGNNGFIVGANPSSIKYQEFFMKKIKIILEYRCYPMWIYNENNEFIDNDLVEELKNDIEVESILMNIQKTYDKLYKDDDVSFEYEGFKDENEKRKFILEIQRAIDLIKLKLANKYIIENCVEI